MPRLHPLRSFRVSVMMCLASITLSDLANAQVAYNDRARARGIDLTWADTYPAGDLGAGVAMEDYDHDGDLDVFVATKRGQALGVYRNDGATFTAVSASLSISSDRDIKQVLFADLDNDGWRELILSVWNPNGAGTSFVGSTIRVYQGLPGGSFVQQHSPSIDLSMTGLATGIAAGDIDRDGDLDLYVSVWKPGPPDNTSRNRLLRNDGNFQFADRAGALGVDDMKKSFQVNLTDLSGDGWLDIVVAEDKGGGATYYRSNGDGTFTDRTVASGLDGFVFVGGGFADGMGVATGDYDGDQDLDVYITNIFDGNLLYRNNGDGTFTDVAVQSGTLSQRIAWGCAFFDCDNDISRDLYVTDFGMNGAFDNRDRLFSNRGDGTFADIASTSGVNFADDGFGMATGDIDGNGGVDVLLSHGGAPIRLLMNEGTVGNWVQLELVGTTSNRDAIGATATVYAGGTVQFFEQRAGESYLSHHSHQMEVGLASQSVVDSVVVWWPSGNTDIWTDLAIGTRHVLTEGRSSVPAVAAPALAARWVDTRLTLSWRVSDPADFDRFEVWDRNQLLITLLAETDRLAYEFTDARANSASSYTLRSVLAGTGETLTTSLRAPTAPQLPQLRLDSPRPNPFNPRVELRFYLPGAVTPQLRILDTRGREVTRLEPSSSPGWQTVVWDGTDAQGRGVASGTYVFEIRTPTQTRTTSMSLVR